MGNRIKPYVNSILRGLQEALETDARGADLIRAAREARRAQNLMAEIVLPLRSRWKLKIAPRNNRSENARLIRTREPKDAG